MYTPCSPKVCKVADSKVTPDSMFGSKNKVGLGLLTTRKINKGEKVYTIWETDRDVMIAPKRRKHDFGVFDYGEKQVIQPMDEEDKPLLYYIQHDSVGNCEVSNCLYYPS